MQIFGFGQRQGGIASKYVYLIEKTIKLIFS